LESISPNDERTRIKETETYSLSNSHKPRRSTRKGLIDWP
jgi:hypothetical protein